MKRRHGRTAIALFRSLLAAGVVETLAEPDEHGRRVRVHADLQDDFSLNHALSLYRRRDHRTRSIPSRPTTPSTC